MRELNIPKLSEEQKITCEGKITSEECFRLLDSFNNNKTPGNDGIPIEFYRKFWPLISDSFIRCVNECFDKGEMSSSQKQAVITLIEKKGKDRAFLENWRPISLVNVDAKIMSKVIASRIKNVLPEIIHHNQTGFVKDRYIGEIILIILYRRNNFAVIRLLLASSSTIFMGSCIWNYALQKRSENLKTAYQTQLTLVVNMSWIFRKRSL